MLHILKCARNRIPKALPISVAQRGEPQFFPWESPHHTQINDIPRKISRCISLPRNAVTRRTQIWKGEMAINLICMSITVGHGIPYQRRLRLRQCLAGNPVPLLLLRGPVHAGHEHGQHPHDNQQQKQQQRHAALSRR
ncbi:hypothetical protein SKTS_04430 [Sulfurimicrobium lacus]|uniref:Uncharacterized protein n=1 Tax=Sulfurimicrobium lacus TaxID=2715678 RepID=A0A6F8V8W0_9PROT|nr:hypothetical protein SKTS_04430 [Sulfurimicrobium lacus]